MEYPVLGEVEVRARGGRSRQLVGRFPLGATATVRSAGKIRKERFRGRQSVSWQVDEFERVQRELASLPKGAPAKEQEALQDTLNRRNTHFLVGHDYGKAIADMIAGTLVVTITDELVTLVADLPEEDRQPSWIRDAVLAVEGGQLAGVSPGFQVPAGVEGELLVEEDDYPDVLIREITDSVVFEYSLVARPSYATTSVDAREFGREGNPGPGGVRCGSDVP